jgi:hypothetical protein
MKNINFKLSSLAAATFLLTACGGGGGSDTSSTAPAPQINQSVPLIMTVAEPTYTVASGDLAAFNYLNAERSHCGFGKVAQNTLLDKAGKNHATYYRANSASSTNSPHSETRGLTGFTGVTPDDRAMAAGYSSKVGEVGAFANAWRNLEYVAPYDTTVIAYNGVRGLMNAPYHTLQMISSAVEVGLGTHKDEINANGVQELNAATFLVFGYGKTSAGQLPTSGTGVRTYPCEGTRNILPNFTGEWTGGAPVEGNRNIISNPLGHPITVIGEHGKTLRLTSAAIVNVATGLDIGVYALRTKENDPNPQLLWNDWSGYIFPNQAFIPGQKYQATINGTSAGVAFSKTFAFWAGQPEDKQETFR